MRSLLILASLLMASWAIAQEDSAPVAELTIGSPAPPLDIEHWIHDGNGHFKPVTDFVADNVYIVEFWATWCGPCISSMPHIVELQNKYKDRGVQVVSVTREDLETVDKFLAREVRGAPKPEEGDEDAKPQTYKDLTSAYCLTSDPDQSTSKDYMVAAKQRGIPCAFVVGKTGHIEWIGHPMSMDDPLEAIVSGEWDREVFAVEFRAQQEAESVQMQAIMKLREKDAKGALEVVDAFLDRTESDAMRTRFQSIRLQILMREESLVDEFAAFAQQMMVDEELQPMVANLISWGIYQNVERGLIDDQELMELALKTASTAAEKSEPPTKGSILDTVAHLHFALGNLEAAIATQVEAIANCSPRQRAQLEQFHKELIKKQQGDSETEEEKPQPDTADSESE